MRCTGQRSNVVDLKIDEDREGGSTGRAGPQRGWVHREGGSTGRAGPQGGRQFNVSVGFPASHSSLFVCLFLLFRDTVLRL